MVCDCVYVCGTVSTSLPPSPFPFSPIGEIFRSRLRQFPSLVNCCTIDWFSEWPDEALRSVARDYMQDITEIDNPDTIPGLVCCRYLGPDTTCGLAGMCVLIA